MPASHPLAKTSTVNFLDTLEFDHIGMTEASAIHAFLRHICDGLHRSLKMRIQVGNFEAAARMIEAGVGIGIMPGSAARRHRRSMAIQILELNDEWALRQMFICVRSLRVLPLFARDLVELLIADSRDSEARGVPKFDEHG